MIAIQLYRGDWRKSQAGYGLDQFESTSIYVYCVYRLTTLELYHAMRNIISLAPDPGPRDSAQSAAPPTYMAPGQLRHWP